jgi:uncharacterized repeat protein (TIGR01451 family)
MDIISTANPLSTGNLAATTTYRAVVQSGGCTAANSTVATVTVTPASVGGTTLAAASSVCPGTGTTITLSGQVGVIMKWQSSTDAINWGDLSSTANPLPTGNLNVTTSYRAVVQNGACAPANSSVATVTVNSPINVSANVTNPTAFGGTGTIQANATGGTGTYSFSINGIKFQNSGTFTGLANGTYIVTAKDTLGCIGTIPAAISAPSAIAVSANTTDPSCSDSLGQVVASAIGGVGIFTYSLDGKGFQNSGTFTGVTPGSHIITAKDGNGITGIKSFAIVAPPALSLSFSKTDTSCATASDGMITAKISGGTGALKVSIDNGPLVSATGTKTFSSIAAGPHTVSLEDANGCTTSQSVSIAAPAPVQVNATPTNPTVFGGKGGIVAKSTGGTGPFTYSINGAAPQTSGSFTGLSVGTYTITAKDANGCNGTATATLSAPGQVAVNVTTTDATCFGATGQLVASGTGGVGGFTYSINSGTFQSSGTFSSLAAGNYTVTAKDGNGATASKSVTIKAPAQVLVNATPTNPTVFGGTGSIVASATGGTGPFTYSIDGSTFQISGTFTGLATGSYTVTAKDANACIGTTSTTLAAPGQIVVNATASNPACAGGTGSIVASATGGVSPFTYSLDGTIYQSSGTFTNLSAGSYTVRAKDGNGVVVTRAVSLTASSPVSINVSASDVTCPGGSDGSITALFGGGSPPYRLSLDSGAFAVQSPPFTFTSVTAGLHTVTVQDAKNCLQTGSVTLGVSGSPVAISAAPVSTSVCPGQPATFTVTATGTGPLKYQWRKDGKDILGAQASSYSVKNVGVGDAGRYTVLVSGACDSELSDVAVLQVTPSVPSITQCASDKTLLAVNCKATVPDLTKEVVATDGCTPGGGLVVTQSPTAGSSIGVGVTIVTLTVQNTSGGQATCQAKLTVTDPEPAISINDVSVVEGNSGTTNAVFTITLSKPACGVVTVNYTSADGSSGGGSSPVEVDPTITVSGNQLLISWPSSLQGYQLESRNGFAPGTLWVPVTQAPTLNGNTYTVTEPLATADSFYQLHLTSGGGSVVGPNQASATAPDDYVPTNGTLTFNPGETSKTITVVVNGDTIYELDEVFVVNLSSPVNATLARAQGIGTILNDDAPPALSINDISVPEGNSGTTPAVFTVRLAGATELPVTVAYSTADGTGKAGVDYQATSGTLSFNPGESTKSITVQVIGNTIYQLDRTFVVNLTSPTSATTAKAQGVGTIKDDDPAPVLAINDATLYEGKSGTTNAIFTVTLAGQTALEARVNFATVDGNAIAGRDYIATAGTLVFAPGETSKNVPIQVIGSTVFEPTKVFYVGLSDSVAATLGRTPGKGTILNDNVLPSVSVADVTVKEGDVGTTDAAFTLTLSAPSSVPVSVDFATADGTAKAGTDYLAASGTVTFKPSAGSGATNSLPSATPSLGLTRVGTQWQLSWTSSGDLYVLQERSSLGPDGAWSNVTASVTVTGNQYSVLVGDTGLEKFYQLVPKAPFDQGETSQTVIVKVIGNTIVQPDRSFFVNLTNPKSATIGRGRAQGTILDDDSYPQLSIADVSVIEGNSGTTPAVFKVSLSAPYGGVVTVQYATADGTANAGSDYVATSGVLSFAAGETNKTITVQVIGDTLNETDETFFVNLSAPVNATLARPQAVGTIIDDDPAPSISIADVSVKEGNSGTTPAVFTISLSAPSAKPISVDFFTSDGTAIAPIDYLPAQGTVSFGPEVDPTETVKPATPPAPTGLAVQKNGGQMVVSWPAATGLGQLQASDAVGTAWMPVTDAPILTGATYQVAVTPSATGNRFYRLASSSIQFGPGETNKSITVLVIGEILYEKDETFFVNLKNPVNATFARAQAVGTILNDDPPPALSINDVTVPLPKTGTVNAVFTVSLGGATALPATVQYATADGTAKAGIDYVAASGSLTFAAGETSKTISVVVNGTALFKPDQTFTVNLTQPGQATIAKAQGVATLKNGNVPPTLSISDVTVTEGNNGTTPAVFTVSLAGSAAVPVTVAYATADDSAKAGVDYQPASGTLTFNPGDTSQTLTVQVIGNTIVQPNRQFFVNLSAPTQATIAKGQGIGTILDDDKVNQPPTVRITSPENDANFLIGLDVPITAEAADPDGTVVRVDFYAGTTLVGTATTAPYTVTWSHVTAVGDYSLTAQATDNLGATTTSSPVLIHVANVQADVAIIRPADNAEIAAMEQYLFDIGLTYYVFDPVNVTWEALQNFKLIIWDDLGQVNGGLQDKDVSLFQQAYNVQLPMYFIGERLAASTTNLSASVRSQWTQLSHLKPASTQGGNGTVHVFTDSNHKVVNGRFGPVYDFAYPAEVDETSQTGTDQILLGQLGDADVLLADEDPATGERTVSQNFMVVNGSNDPDSISERQRLFWNAVWWLLRKPMCGLTDLAISQTATPNPANTGNQLTYTLVVQRSGECEGTGVTVTDVLPPNAKFVSADTPQGTWSEDNGVVTFHLGLLQEVLLQLTVVVEPLQPGQITNNIQIRGNESEVSLSNNSSSLTLDVQGNPIPQAMTNSQMNLGIRIASDGSPEIRFNGQNGVTYTLQTSSDLVNWTPWANIVGTGSPAAVSNLPKEAARFYRMVTASKATEQR